MSQEAGAGAHDNATKSSSGTQHIVPALSRVPYLLSAKDVIYQLRVRSDNGLSSAVAAQRRQAVGTNTIARNGGHSPLLIFFDRFRDALVLLLLAAAVISLLLGEIADAAIIAVAILADVTLSFVQSYRAERTLERLRQHVELMCNVVRDGSIKRLPASELTVGDIIEFRAGEKIPADARLLSGVGLKVQESALTGESDDTSKSPEQLRSRTSLGDRRNMLFMGTTVMNGHGRAVVTAVGSRTEFGKIAQTLKEEKAPPSPLRQKLQHTGIVIAWIIIALVLAISAVAFWQGDSLADSARTAITLIVSAIPEDLTIILTIALTVGVIRILRQQGVVRELSSGETLGAATVICTDKTGTLTQGVMQAEEFIIMNDDAISSERPPTAPLEKLGMIGLVVSGEARRTGPNERTYIGSTTERAALAFAESLGFIKSELMEQWRRRDIISFDTKWKYQAVLVDHATQGTQVLFVAGAPEVLLEASSQVLDSRGGFVPLTDTKRASLQQELTKRASSGKRLLAVAMKRHLNQSSITRDDVDGLEFIGMLTITDPIRPEIPDAIAQTKSAGVQVKLVTGDFPATAQAIAGQAGLGTSPETTVTGEQLQLVSDDELVELVEHTTIFARVEPLDKQRIIRALKARGHVVAMTGDGVNDAVALRSADIGVAMGSGKDIAKDASDLVLLDDNFTTIVAAIREGRVLRDNVRKVTSFLLATNAAEVAIFIVSLLLRLPLPLVPAQILWINIVTDGTSDIALSLEPEERNVMHRRPEDPSGSLFNRDLVFKILLAGGVITAFAMGLYWYLYEVRFFPLVYVRTMIFTFVALASLLSTWSYRSLWESIARRGLFANRWLFASAGFSLALQLLAVYLPRLQVFFGTVPLSLYDWLLLLALAIAAVFVIDLRKVLPTSRRSPSPQRVSSSLPAPANVSS